MRNVRRTLRIVLFLIVGLWLHYVMPQQDTVRITGTVEEAETISGFRSLFFAQADSGAAAEERRTLRLINTQKQRTYLFGLIHRGSEETMVYRNEDTGWIYPPYFKFDSSDLQAEAQDFTSTSAEPQWVIITHYGWRTRWATIYPNAISIRPAPSPDYRPFPWVNLILFGLMIGGILFIRAMWMQFRERTVDPLADRVGDQLDHVNADLAERKGRISRWLGTWRRK